MACKGLGANEVCSRGYSELKHLFHSCMQFRRLGLNPGGFFQFQFYVHSLFVQSRLYQQNLEAFFESSNEESLEEMANRL